MDLLLPFKKPAPVGPSAAGVHRWARRKSARWFDQLTKQRRRWVFGERPAHWPWGAESLNLDKESDGLLESLFGRVWPA